MPALLAPYLCAAAVVALAGGAKAARPADTARALRQLGWPGTPALVRLLGVAEVVVGVSAAATGARLPAALLAVSYAGFAVFVATALARGGAVSSCGCFGRPDTPPTRSHLAVVSSLALVCTAVAIRPSAGLAALHGARGLLVLAMAGLATWFAVLSMTLLPRLRGLAGAAPRGDAA